MSTGNGSVAHLVTPSARTRDEHPLTESDWETCRRIFSKFHHKERELVTIPLMPLNWVLPKRARSTMAKWATQLDDRLLAQFPELGKYARITFLVLE